ncbi:MAG: ROK family protein [Acidobacteriota bacterium]|nr:MAG: ROK family protein [Acidobacteriota bacterium]
MNILVVDVGGTNIKVLATGHETPVKFPSGRKMTARKMVDGVLGATREWSYEAISIGFPGPVAHNKLLSEPKNLGGGWLGFPYEKALGHPVRILNDAAMQALGSYKGGRMLFLGLGTGLGSALIVDGVLAPLELAHLTYKKGKTYEDYLGARGLERRGKAKWRRSVRDVIKMLRLAMEADYVVLGGGNAKKIQKLPPHAFLGANANAFKGGFRMWESLDKVRAATE